MSYWGLVIQTIPIEEFVETNSGTQAFGKKRKISANFICLGKLRGHLAFPFLI